MLNYSYLNILFDRSVIYELIIISSEILQLPYQFLSSLISLLKKLEVKSQILVVLQLSMQFYLIILIREV